MNANAFALLMLGAIAVSLSLAGYYFVAAFDQARPMLPAPLQDEFAARFAFDRFIWSGTTHRGGPSQLSPVTCLRQRRPFGHNRSCRRQQRSIHRLAARRNHVLAIVVTLRAWRRYRAG